MSGLRTPGLRRLQLRITATAMAGVVVVVVLAGVGLVRLFEREQVRRVDDRLQGVADFLDRNLASGSPLQGEAGPDDYVQVVADGRVVYSSPPLEGLPPIVDVDRVGEDDVRFETVTPADAGEIRIVTTPLTGDQVLIYGQSLAGVNDSVSSLQGSLLFGLPFVIGGLGLVVWLIVGRTLRPVDAALIRERRLVADASHDLRTPLAGMRALLETEPDGPAELATNRIDALATLDRLEVIVNDLLVLSRADRSDSGERPLRLVDLDEIVLREVHLLGHGTDVSIETSEVSAGQVVGNASDLERVVENLLGNALRHARTQVAVELDEAGGEVVLVVDDDGPGVAPEDRERIFDRFTRLDESRTAGGGGAGLGLAIVREVVTAHGGQVSVDRSPFGGASFRVVLPASVKVDEPART